MINSVNRPFEIDLHGARQLMLHGQGMAMASGDAPDWIQLLPAGQIQTIDGRGPYRYADAQKLIAASMAGRSKLVIDINHATDLSAPKGGEAPAQGWIVELQARADGIWGRVEWTDAGRARVAAREYSFISPALTRDAKFNVLAIQRASLVNNPNLIGLADLNSEQNMDMDKLRAALGLAADAAEDAILAAATGLSKGLTDLQSAVAPLAEALGLKKDAPITDLQAAAISLAEKARAKPETGVDKDQLITDLQASLKTQGAQIEDLNKTNKHKEAVDFVDQAIRDGRVGVKPQRDRFIDLHMANPDQAKALVEGLPKLAAHSETRLLPPSSSATGETALTETDRKVTELLGIDPKNMAETRATEGAIGEVL